MSLIKKVDDNFRILLDVHNNLVNKPTWYTIVFS